MRLAKIKNVAVVVVVVSAMTGSPVTAAPLNPATVSTVSAGFTDAMPVDWRGRGGGGAGLAAGLATGFIVGGLLAAPRYYEPHPYYLEDYPPRYGGPIAYGSPSWEAYCFSRYRSFDPVTGTYRGRDGRRHYCQ